MGLGIQLDGLRLSERTALTNQFIGIDRDTEAAIAGIMAQSGHGTRGEGKPPFLRPSSGATHVKRIWSICTEIRGQ